MTRPRDRPPAKRTPWSLVGVGVGRPERFEHLIGVALGVGLTATGSALLAACDAVVVMAEFVRQDVQELKGSGLGLGPRNFEMAVLEQSGRPSGPRRCGEVDALEEACGGFVVGQGPAGDV